jgi:hypothetical protein
VQGSRFLLSESIMALSVNSSFYANGNQIMKDNHVEKSSSVVLNTSSNETIYKGSSGESDEEIISRELDEAFAEVMAAEAIQTTKPLSAHEQWMARQLSMYQVRPAGRTFIPGNELHRVTPPPFTKHPSAWMQSK